MSTKIGSRPTGPWSNPGLAEYEAQSEPWAECIICYQWGWEGEMTAGGQTGPGLPHVHSAGSGRRQTLDSLGPFGSGAGYF